MAKGKAIWTDSAENQAVEILTSHAQALREVAEHVAIRSDSEHVSAANVISASSALKLTRPIQRVLDALGTAAWALFGLGGGAALATISSAAPTYNGWFVAEVLTAMVALPLATVCLALRWVSRA